MKTACSTLTLVTVLVSVSACGPEVGQYYEHHQTHDRIRIDRIGICKQLNAHYEGMNELVKAHFSTRGGRLAFSVTPLMAEADSLKSCVSYKEDRIVRSHGGEVFVVDGREYFAVPVQLAHIIPVQDLLEAYRPVD